MFKKMNKKQFFILGFALVAFGFMACDNESVQLNTNEPETEINLLFEEIFNEIASSLGVDITFEAVEVFYGFCSEFAVVTEFEFDHIALRNSAVRDDWDIDKSMTVRTTMCSGEDFTMIATPHKDNANVVSLVMLSSTGEGTSFIAGFDGVFDVFPFDEFEPIDIGSGFIRHRPDGWNWTVGQHIGCALAGVVLGGGLMGALGYVSCLLIIDNGPSIIIDNGLQPPMWY